MPKKLRMVDIRTRDKQHQLLRGCFQGTLPIGQMEKSGMSPEGLEQHEMLNGLIQLLLVS